MASLVFARTGSIWHSRSLSSSPRDDGGSNKNAATPVADAIYTSLHPRSFRVFLAIIYHHYHLFFFCLFSHFLLTLHSSAFVSSSPHPIREPISRFPYSSFGTPFLPSPRCLQPLHQRPRRSSGHVFDVCLVLARVSCRAYTNHFFIPSFSFNFIVRSTLYRPPHATSGLDSRRYHTYIQHSCCPRRMQSVFTCVSLFAFGICPALAVPCRFLPP